MSQEQERSSATEAEPAATDHRVPPIPADLKQTRPLKWAPAEGSRGGFMAQVEYVLYRLIVGAAARLPRPLETAMVAVLSRLAKAVDRRHTGAARRFLTQAMGPELTVKRREELVLGAYRQLFKITLSGERLFAKPDLKRLDEVFETDLCEDAERFRQDPRGGCFVSAHIGNWEVPSLLLPRRGFDPLYLIARPPKNQPLSRYIQRSREQCGTWVIERKGALRGSRRVFKAGGFLGLLPDQRARVAPIVVPFFGRLANTEQSPSLFLLRFKVPQAIVYCIYLEGRDRFRFVMSEVMWPEDFEGQTPEQVTTYVNRALEKIILKHPEQYFWLHDRYRNAPSEAEPASDRSLD